MNKRLLLTCVFIIALAFSLSAQVRFKLASWNATKLSGDNGYTQTDFSYYSFGGIADKRFKINHEIRIGLFYKSMEFTFNKDDYGFNNFLSLQHPGMTAAEADSVKQGRVAFGYLSIPVGYNFYVSPRFYLSYNFNLNFSLNNAHYSALDVNEDDVFTGKLGKNMVQTVFVDHELTFNLIILRRVELFLGVSWNINSNLLKQSSSYTFVEEFGKSSAKYTMMKLGANLYLFQLKRKKL